MRLTAANRYLVFIFIKSDKSDEKEQKIYNRSDQYDFLNKTQAFLYNDISASDGHFCPNRNNCLRFATITCVFRIGIKDIFAGHN